MLESLFIMLIAIAFITFLLGIDSESYPMNLYTKIQKCIKLKKKLANGQEWEDSCKAIFKEISGNSLTIEVAEDEEVEEEEE